jgi:short-subunit dehydrogenase
MADSWVLITGASSGIGLELAKVFASRMHSIVLVARDPARLDKASREIRGTYGVNAFVVSKDLAAPNAAGEVFSELQREDIQVSILVNNAGFGLAGAFAENNLQMYLEMIQVNMTALVELTHLLLQPMLARGEGKILNVASTAAFQPGPLMSIYYASKAFVFSFSYALAEELEGTGVTVTTVCPGPTRSNFHARAGTTRLERIF